jgi:O-antigen/teichoic acid export membrane protein
MSTVQRVAKNTGIVIAGNVIFRLISLFVLIYLARYLGTASFGKYSFVFAYLAFFGVITDLGLQPILVREMSRDPPNAPKLIGNAYVIRFILTMLAFILSIVVISLMSYPTDTTTYIYIAAFTLLFISFSDFYATIFTANLRMGYNIIAKIVYRSLSAGLIIWIIFSHGTLAQILTVTVFSEMIKTLINYFYSRKFVKPRFEIDFGLWKHLLKESLPIALSSIILIIYIRTDIVMLSIMEGDVAVGYYSGASKIYDTLTLIPSAFMVSMFPIMSASFKNSKDRLIKSYRLSFRYLLIIILPIAIGTTLLADEFIFLLYGAEFAGSASALQILIWALVFTSVNSVLLHLLTSINKQKLNTFSHTMCAIANVTLNFILIPIMSYNGAAIATVTTTVVLFIASFYFVSKHLQVLPVHKIVIKPVIGSLLMGAFIYYFVEHNILLLVPLAGIVYLVALLALKTFSKEDLDIVKRIIGKG